MSNAYYMAFETAESYERMIAEVERAAAEKAWDEGYQEANSDLWREGGREGNPYRAAEIRERKSDGES